MLLLFFYTDLGTWMTENLGSELKVRAPTLNTVTSATRIQVTMYESARSFALGRCFGYFLQPLCQIPLLI